MALFQSCDGLDCAPQKLLRVSPDPSTPDDAFTEMVKLEEVLRVDLLLHDFHSYRGGGQDLKV